MNEHKRVTLSYFNFAGGRGEDCRLALYIAGVDFIDNRVDFEQWSALKPSTPFGGMPILEIEGEGILAQSNAILGLIGDRHGLLPDNNFMACQHRAILNACEDLLVRIELTMQMNDEEKKKTREKIASDYMVSWSNNMGKLIQGPFFAKEGLSVADLKLHGLVGWIKSGDLDHFPVNYFNDYPKLTSLYDAVASHPKVQEWYTKK